MTGSPEPDRNSVDAGPPTVTVLIPTRNRADDLMRTLESLMVPGNLHRPGWDVLVVDNGSTDHTGEVCETFARSFPCFRWIRDERRGKSNALNSGLLAASGVLIAMTDDDVLCAPDFIQGIQELFADPSVDSAQGRVLLDWLGGEPGWVDELAVQFMSLRDYGDVQFDWSDNLSGCNMVVRREAALRVGGFAAELGPGTIGIAEDSEFSVRLREHGFRAVYAPDILVRHQVPAGRVTPRFLRRRYFGVGRSYAYYTPLKSPLWRFALYVLKDLTVAEVRAAYLRIIGRRSDAVRRQCSSRQRLGFFWQHLYFRLGIRERKLTYIPPDARTRIGEPAG